MGQQNNLSLTSDSLVILRCVGSSRAVGRGENCPGQADRAERGCSTESDSGLDVTPEGTPYTRCSAPSPALLTVPRCSRPESELLLDGEAARAEEEVKASPRQLEMLLEESQNSGAQSQNAGLPPPAHQVLNCALLALTLPRRTRRHTGQLKNLYG